jgi:hypothetical protein
MVLVQLWCSLVQINFDWHNQFVHQISYTALDFWYKMAICIAVRSGLSGIHWLLAGLGGLIMFAGIYDRCPIYQWFLFSLKRFFLRTQPAYLITNSQ